MVCNKYIQNVLLKLISGFYTFQLNKYLKLLNYREKHVQHPKHA